MLGREPVLDRDDDRAELARDRDREAVLHVDVADDEAAAVDVEQRGAPGRGRGVEGAVHAHRHGTVRSRDLPVVDVDPGRVDVRVQRRDQGLDPGAGLRDIAQVADREELDDRSQFGVECIRHAGMFSRRSVLVPGRLVDLTGTVAAMTDASDPHAVRAAYDEVAADYAELLRDELAAKPFDRALLGVFAECVLSGSAGPVADVGCGPGRVTAYLHGLGVEAFGIDLSPAMVAVARLAHPDIRFDVGTMTALNLPDGALGGILAWYSIIHTPPEHLPEVFAEFHRVLGPGGHLLLAFQVGDHCVHLEHAYGHAVSLDAYRQAPDRIAGLLTRAGFDVVARLVREPDPAEKTPQANIVARKPGRDHDTA